MKNITKVVAATALGAAAAGAVALGAGSASAVPYDGITDGTYAVSADVARGVGVPAGTATIRDGVLTYNGASARLTKTPGAYYAAATAILPGYGKVALLPDGVSGRDAELVIGGSADSPNFTMILSMRK